MKVIFITREGYNLPGARVRCYHFARELIRYGIDADVLSFSDTLGAKEGKEEFRLGLRDKLKLNYLAFRKLLEEKEVLFYVHRFNYHAFSSYLLHFFRGNKMILDLDDWEIRENPKYYLGFYPSSKAHYFTREIAKKSIACIAASRFLEVFLKPLNNHVYYIPSGVDTQLFKPRIQPLDDEKIIFSWIGTFNKKEYLENIKLALECFRVLRKKYSHIYFDIVGDGIYHDDLRQMVETFGDSHICLKGWLLPHEVPAYLDGVHIGLLPVCRDTKFNRAKSPTKLFEYMAMAKPAIASDIGEAPFIIRDGFNGFLAATKDIFIEKMQHLIENSLLRQQMGAKARETVEQNYSLVVLGRRLCDVFRFFL